MRNLLQNRGAFFLIVVAPFGHACSGGYGRQPTGNGGSNGQAGAYGTAGEAGGAVGHGGVGGSGGAAGAAGGAAGAAAGGRGGTVAAGAGGGGTGGTGTAGTGGTGGTLSPVNPPSCDAIGSEPTIPPACMTVLATKTIASGEPSDETLDTAAINAAITACPAGQSVRLAADGDKTAFVAAGIVLKTGVSLWLDAGTTLFLSRNAGDSDTVAGAAKCGGNDTGNTCTPLIAVPAPANSGVFGTGTIDGRGGEVLTGGTSNWWDLENADNGNLAAPRLIQVSSGTNFVLYGITLKNAPKFHVAIDNTVGFQVWGITINTPANSPNTDGVDPFRTKNGVIAYTKISTGDDNVAVKGGTGLVDGLIVAHNHFGRGHGMSIGSETNGGVRNVSVCDLSLDGTDNGLRIKSDSSKGGLVQGIAYSDVCIRNSRHPLVFDPYYTSSTGTLIPDFRDITVTNVHVLAMGGSSTFRGWDAAHPLGITLSNVIFDVAPTTITASYANVVFGPQAVNIKPAGTSVTVTDQVTGSDPPRNCDNAWVTF